MPHLRLSVPPAPVFAAGFGRIRDQLDIASRYPTAAVEEASHATDSHRGERRDRTDLPLVTIDPPGSRDLDQAVHVESTASGWRVHYAIADVSAFVEPGGALDRETRERGLTLYPPDGNVPLHPAVLSEGAASLLPGADRPAVLWTVELDAEGEAVTDHIERALVRSRAQLTYAEVQRQLDASSAPDNLVALARVGELRQELARRRGAVQLDLPSQEVVELSPGRFDLIYEASLPIEEANAQISLLTGMLAARRFVDAGRGLLRTLPPADPAVIDRLRSQAAALEVPWPQGVGHAEFITGLDGMLAPHAALLTQALGVFRGAGYLAMKGEVPEQRSHAAIAADYSHVTAPLRRLCDRYANELLLADEAGTAAPSWAEEALEELPSIMGRASQRERSLERAMVDFVEVALLGRRLGETVEGIVTDPGETSTVQILDPAVVTRADIGRRELAERVTLEVVAVDLVARTVDLVPAG